MRELRRGARGRRGGRHRLLSGGGRHHLRRLPGPGKDFLLDGDALGFMSDALAKPLRDAPEAPRQTIGQVDRAVTGTLEYHAHVRLRSVA